jgi:hypothetical protein
LAPGIKTCPSGQVQPTLSVQVNPSGQSQAVSEFLLDKELMLDPQTLQETTSETVKRTAFAFEQTHDNLVLSHFMSLVRHSHCPANLVLTAFALTVASQVVQASPV